MKKTIAAFALATVMMVSTTFANGGILVLGFAGQSNTNECTQPADNKEKGGIIVSDLGGILVLGFTGIIISDLNSGGTVNCGIVIAD
jgi:hypothetical protein